MTFIQCLNKGKMNQQLLVEIVNRDLDTNALAGEGGRLERPRDIARIVLYI
jgi:hypothetical protein